MYVFAHNSEAGEYAYVSNFINGDLEMDFQEANSLSAFAEYYWRRTGLCLWCSFEFIGAFSAIL